MDKQERTKMIKAMEFIARQVNDEEVFDNWLLYGVADGDIEYGDLAGYTDDDANDVEFWLDDDEFADLMGNFLFLMKQAYKSGGLYCDKVVSKE